MIYFDNAATTKINPEVLDAMYPYMTDEYGNTEGKYYSLAVKAKEKVNESRDKIASFFGCDQDEVIFTSGATEANNLVIKGLFFSNIEKRPHFITSKIEHSSILETYKYIEKLGAEVTYLDVDKEGLINLGQLKESIKQTTLLLSISYVNGEIGSVQDLKMIDNICAKGKVPIHLDITQSILHKRINISDYKSLAFLSFSAHKIYGPKGIGALIIRKDEDGIKRKIDPIIHGGSQEFGFRGGTLPVFLIVGLAKAIELIEINQEKYNQHLYNLDSYFLNKINKDFQNAFILNNNFKIRVKGIINIRILKFNNQLLLKRGSDFFAASTGSACSNTKPSYVLKEVGLDIKAISESVRFSLGIYNTIGEIDQFFNIFEK